MKCIHSKLLGQFKERVRSIWRGPEPGAVYEETRGGRSWEDYYRRRWQHDKVVRSTHGVNCTGSCSFDVFVKDGIIVWEAQKTDYPTPHPDFPDYEPRGCPRGTCASWYVYSPLRVKYPYIRETLYKMWQTALQQYRDPVLAWQSIQADPVKRKAYHAARGKGGFVRFSWDEAAELVAASLVHTILEHGPDRIFGFTPLPAMSMTSFASGARFLSLIGASMISFYDWYCDLPPASPQIWGEQTDVCESADWYNAGYILCWGSNIPQTRTPDAHFYSECRYRGTRITAISPDYADFTKLADHWLPVCAGTDGALAMAMVHVVVKEFFLDRDVPYFINYAKRFTDLPFLVFVDAEDTSQFIGLKAGRFVRASDLADNSAHSVNNAEWKLAVFDEVRNAPAVPMGSIGSRYGEEGTWNLEMKDCVTREDLHPALTLAHVPDADWEIMAFPAFEGAETGLRLGAVPTLTLTVDGKPRRVTTVYDLLLGSLSLDRGHGGDVAANYKDSAAYATPAWQEIVTGVPADDVIRVARDFAENAEATQGRSLIIMGAGINHWYNNDNTYRAIISLTSLCGCQGVSGGGWAHYVGQEKVRPLAGWGTVTMGTDWMGPPRLHNGTSFYYFATDAWRHELLNIETMCPPTGKGNDNTLPAHPADCNAKAVRLGWLPFYPQFRENSLEVCVKARQAGADSPEAIIAHTVKRLQSGDLPLAVDAPDHPDNVPRVMIFWRANPLGSNVKGHEYFLKYLLGTQDSVLGQESAFQPVDFDTTPFDVESSGGKLDLMVTSEIRMSTSCVYSDVVLPAAHWYEYNDLNSTDMHPFIHPFTAAVDPPWEARANWEQFDVIARAFSRLAETHLGTREDMVATALQHDSKGEIAQPFGEVREWRNSATEAPVDAVPGKTMFNLKVVERRYADIYKMYSSLGPNVCKPGGVGAKGVSWSCAPEYENLKARLGTVQEPGCSFGMPKITTGKDACEIVLTLSPESNGNVGVRSWQSLEKQTGFKLNDLSRPVQDERMTFESVTARPSKSFTSPNWSGIENHGRTYTPFELNVQRLVPFHTLSGRQHFYIDHEWMRSLGEALPVYRPPLPLVALGEISGSAIPRAKGGVGELVLNFLSPHSKWSIHSSYSDILLLRTLSRGGGEIWLNDEDAASAGIADNEWLECFNVNGVFMGRAVVTYRIPRGKTFIHHAQERCVNVPLSPLSGTRGGTHNSLTRALVKPTQMVGGYAQLSYSYNYYGPTGCQRDEYIVIRKAGKVVFDEH